MGFQHDGPVEKCLVCVNVTCSKVDLTWKGGCMSSLFIGCNSDGFFHVGAPDYTVPPRTIERSHGKTSGSCDVVDGNML